MNAAAEQTYAGVQAQVIFLAIGARDMADSVQIADLGIAVNVVTEQAIAEVRASRHLFSRRGLKRHG